MRQIDARDVLVYVLLAFCAGFAAALAVVEFELLPPPGFR